MDKKNLEVGAFVVIGIAILAIWGWQFLKPETPKPEESVLKTPEVTEVKIEEETLQYKINVSYPEFRNLGDAPREEGANKAIKAKTDQSITALKDASREAVDISSAIKSEIQIDYEVVDINSQIASIRFRESTYVEGAAHPLSIYWPVNYSFKDSREIALADLFKPGTSYLGELSRLSKEALKSQLGDYYAQEVVEFGTAPASENFSTFFLEKDKLVIVFNVYSVAAYAAGAQTVEIPYEKLSGFINPEGLIKLIRST